MTTQNAKLEELLDLVEGRLSEEQARQLTEEIEADPELQAAHRWVRNFESMAARTTLVPAPPSTHAMLVGLLPQPRRIGDTLDQFVDFVGRLIRDVAVGPTLAGARGVALDSKRQLLFDAGDDTDVTIELSFSVDAVLVSGQLLADYPAADVLVIGDQSTIELSTDAYGEFSSEIPRPMSLRLQITTTSRRVELDLTPYLDPAVTSTRGTS